MPHTWSIPEPPIPPRRRNVLHVYDAVIDPILEPLCQHALGRSQVREVSNKGHWPQMGGELDAAVDQALPELPLALGGPHASGRVEYLSRGREPKIPAFYASGDHNSTIGQ